MPAAGRFAHATELAHPQPYEPVKDFWKQYREGLVRAERTAVGEPRGDLAQALEGVVSNAFERKQASYAQATRNWRGLREGEGRLAGGSFRDPHPTIWQPGTLPIRIAPSVALSWPAGTAAIVAVHVNSTTRINTDIANVMLWLMEHNAGNLLRGFEPQNIDVFVFDIMANRLFAAPATWPPGFDRVLATEAAGLANLMNEAA